MSVTSTVEAVTKPTKRKATATKKNYARSRVGNGQVLLAGIDQRSLAYREYQDSVADLVSHMGGEPTAVQQAIIEEASGLIVCGAVKRAQLCSRARPSTLRLTPQE